MSYNIGLTLGKFYPIHYGHINMIFEALSTMNEMHVVICSETERDHQLFLESQFHHEPTPEDRIHWAETIFQDFDNIIIHHLNEDGLPPYPKGWTEWTERTLKFIETQKINPTHIFSSEPQDKPEYERLFKLPVTLVDTERDRFPVSATKVRNEPYYHWKFIPTIIRPAFTKRILLTFSDTPKMLELQKMLSVIFKTTITQNLAILKDTTDAPQVIFINSQSALTHIEMAAELDAIITDQTLSSNLPLLQLLTCNDALKNYSLAKQFIHELLQL